MKPSNGGHYLNFGAGPNQLPAPWQNLTIEHDIRKRLRFADCSVEAILAEHVIEHVPFLSGFAFLQECFRILQPGGVLRVCFPDPSRFVMSPRGSWSLKETAAQYAAALADTTPFLNTPAFELERMIVGWGHQAMWTEAAMAAVLLVLGFEDVQTCFYNQSVRGLAGVDGHHRTVGTQAAELETTILEAFKPREKA
jgi:hypothetical protein